MGYTTHGKPEFHSKKEKLLLTIAVNLVSAIIHGPEFPLLNTATKPFLTTPLDTAHIFLFLNPVIIYP
jgi:hypothetical protein